MGLLNKIEDKLSSNKSADSNYTESSSTGHTSSLQHPVSSGTSGPTGTAVPNTTSSSSGGGPTVGYNRSDKRNDYDSIQPSAYGTQDRHNAQDGYGTQERYGNEPSGYDGHNSTTRTEVPGSHGSHDPRTTTTTNTTTTSPREPYNPFSSKGQRTAASAAHEHGMSPSTNSNRAPYDDAEVSRSHRGGITNSVTNSTPGQYGADSGFVNAAPHASSGQEGLSSARHEPSSGHNYGRDEPSSSHHYGRDAATAGGVGAAGVGAYEVGKHQQGSSSQNYSRPQEDRTSYGNREGGERSTHTGGLGSSGTGHDHAKKMGAIYEQGYRDGMEHMRQEMENARLGR